MVAHQRVLIWTRPPVYLFVNLFTYLPIHSCIYSTDIYWAPTISVLGTALGAKEMWGEREIKFIALGFFILLGRQIKNEKREKELSNSKYEKKNQERKLIEWLVGEMWPSLVWVVHASHTKQVTFGETSRVKSGRWWFFHLEEQNSQLMGLEVATSCSRKGQESLVAGADRAEREKKQTWVLGTVRSPGDV